MKTFIKQNDIYSEEVSSFYETKPQWENVENDQEFISKSLEYAKIERKKIFPRGKYARTLKAIKYEKGQSIIGSKGSFCGSSVAINSTGDKIAVAYPRWSLNVDLNMVEVSSGILPPSSSLAGKKANTFLIRKFETTWGEWKEVRDWAVLNGYDLQNIGQGISDSHPVTNVNWYDVVKWCNAKSEMNKLVPVYILKNGDIYKTGSWEFGEISDVISRFSNGYRLPSEEEWEWAARGGTNSSGFTYSGGNDLESVAWYRFNSNLTSHEVGLKNPNELGLFDMTGNVGEWCNNLLLIGVLDHRPVRGGRFWEESLNEYKLDSRSIFTTDSRINSIGFRIARYHKTLFQDIPSGFLSVSAGSGGTKFIKNFQLNKYETTLEEWNEVKNWAITNGYSDLSPFASAPSNLNPVSSVTYFDMLKWCNAKSEREGKKAYYLLKENLALNNMVSVQGGRLSNSSLMGNKFVNTFEINKFEVTFGEWKEVRDWAVLNGYSDLNGVGAGVADNHPVYNVNYYHVIKWCNAKSEKENLTPVYRNGLDPFSGTYKIGENPNFFINKLANGYRLPTEHEWEFAATDRGLSIYVYSGDNNLNIVGWFEGNTQNITTTPKTQPVGTKFHNTLGIKDMSGNLSEWCWAENFISNKPIRGGSWADEAQKCTVFYRESANLNLISNKIGFRVARTSSTTVYKTGGESVRLRINVDEFADGYRIPNNFEWKWAAIGATKSLNYNYPGSNQINDVAWYSENSGGSSRPVGEKNANELGLFDMSGNIAEIVLDERFLSLGVFVKIVGGFFGNSNFNELGVPYDESSLPGFTYYNSGLGFRIAINSEPNSFINGDKTENGKVIVFGLEQNQWKPIGEEIFGLSSFDYSGAGILGGKGVAINNSGNIIAISNIGYDKDGIINLGQIKVFEYKNNEWVQQNSGNVLDGLSTGDFMGNIDMNDEGNILISASYLHDNNNLNNCGVVKIFEYAPDIASGFVNKKWFQLGSEIYGEEDGEGCGYSVSINKKGDVIAVGCPFYNFSTGRVKILERKNGGWSLLGGYITGDSTSNMCGDSIDLNGDGNKLIISSSGENSVKVYELINLNWVQIGQKIYLGEENNNKKITVNINDYGNQILITSFVSSENCYKTKSYYYNDSVSQWELAASVINTINAEEFGVSVDIDNNGNSIIIGNPGYSELLENQGNVKVLQIPSIINSADLNSKIAKKYDESNFDCDTPQIFFKDRNLRITSSYLLDKNITFETVKETPSQKMVETNFVYQGKRNLNDTEWDLFTIKKSLPLNAVEKITKFKETWFTAYECPDINNCDTLKREVECCDSCFSVGLLGDSGYPPLTDDLEIINKIKSINTDYVLHLGSVNYLNTSNYSQYRNFVDANFKNLWGPDWLKKMYLAFGAYDLVTDYGNYIWESLDLVKSATNSNINKRHYDFVIGDAHFFVINTGNLASGISIDETKDQNLNWLAQINDTLTALKNSVSRWRILVCSKPPYSSNLTHFPGSTKIRTLGGVPLEDLGIDLVLSSYVRNYEHLIKNNIHYVIQGLGGAPKHSTYSTQSIEAQSVFRYAAQTSFSVLNISLKSLVIETKNLLGESIDSFTINK
jgi:sulfatase modifying factor 1